MPEYRTFEDYEDVHPWTWIAEEYEPLPEGDVLLNRFTLFDNGIEREELFDFGIRSITYSQDRGGPEGLGVKPWDFVELRYNPLGEIEYRMTYNDDGTIYEDFYAFGIITSSTRYDDGYGANGDGARPWQMIDIQYDPIGLIEFRTTLFDDGTYKEERFFEGRRESISHYDYDFGNGGAKPWQSVETLYNPLGEIEMRVTFFDDGGTTEERFWQGQRSEILRYDGWGDDGTGSHAWQSVEAYYDQNGALEFRFTIYDDGVTKEEQFFEGQRQYTNEYDFSAPGAEGARDWQNITTSYDFEGRIESRSITYDNGVSRFETYFEGRRQDISEYDNMNDPFGDQDVDWVWRQTYYDDDGQVERFDVEYDNGVTRYETYQDGKQVALSMTDNFGAPGGAEDWTYVSAAFDFETGEMIEQITDYDDGRSRLELFDGGQRTFSVLSDGFIGDSGPGQHAWSDVLVFFDDAGRAEARVRTWDNGDAVAEFFAGGQRVARHFADGDGDKPWFGRIVTYDEWGQVSDDQVFATEMDVTPEFFDLPPIPWPYDGLFDMGVYL